MNTVSGWPWFHSMLPSMVCYFCLRAIVCLLLRYGTVIGSCDSFIAVSVVLPQHTSPSKTSILRGGCWFCVLHIMGIFPPDCAWRNKRKANLVGIELTIPLTATQLRLKTVRVFFLQGWPRLRAAAVRCNITY